MDLVEFWKVLTVWETATMRSWTPTWVIDQLPARWTLQKSSALSKHLFATLSIRKWPLYQSQNHWPLSQFFRHGKKYTLRNVTFLLQQIFFLGEKCACTLPSVYLRASDLQCISLQQLPLTFNQIIVYTLLMKVANWLYDLSILRKACIRDSMHTFGRPLGDVEYVNLLENFGTKSSHEICAGRHRYVIYKDMQFKTGQDPTTIPPEWHSKSWSHLSTLWLSYVLNMTGAKSCTFLFAFCRVGLHIPFILVKECAKRKI